MKNKKSDLHGGFAKTYLNNLNPVEKSLYEQEYMIKLSEYLRYIVEQYKDTNLKNSKDVEVSFYCDNYYLINEMYFDTVNDLFYK
ncbi:MAG: hypothetical protein HPY57_14245 [Ignavibacteria bacterium]|nr:hypothetical protein [Ignavibacteria bacterium]